MQAKRKLGRKGVTLVELIVVIGLLGLVGACIGAYFEPLQKIYYQTQELSTAKRMHTSIGRQIREWLRFSNHLVIAESDTDFAPDAGEYYILSLNQDSQLIRTKMKKNEDGTSSVADPGADGNDFGSAFYEGKLLRWGFRVEAPGITGEKAVLVMSLSVCDRDGTPLYGGAYPIKLMNLGPDEVSISDTTDTLSENANLKIYYQPSYGDVATGGAPEKAEPNP